MLIKYNLIYLFISPNSWIIEVSRFVHDVSAKTSVVLLENIIVILLL